MNEYYSDDIMNDVDNFLEHYGVKGMKWRKRKKKNYDMKKALRNAISKGRSRLSSLYKNVKSEAKARYKHAKAQAKRGINKAYRAATGTKLGKAAWNKAHGYSQEKLNKYHEDINNNSRWAEGYAKQQKAAERKSNKLMGLYGEANNEKYKQELMDRSNEAGREAEAYKTKKKAANRKKNNARVEISKYNKAYKNRSLF